MKSLLSPPPTRFNIAQWGEGPTLLLSRSWVCWFDQPGQILLPKIKPTNPTEPIHQSTNPIHLYLDLIFQDQVFVILQMFALHFENWSKNVGIQPSVAIHQVETMEFCSNTFFLQLPLHQISANLCQDTFINFKKFDTEFKISFDNSSFCLSSIFNAIF